ncbi:hypothetical protein [Dapis sp. BLCC M172]|uniref:hypothetical protein n=1 Tax=Dapis sp. BLCC M172 TaxID=2975281 RepID=UPI003CE8CC0E
MPTPPPLPGAPPLPPGMSPFPSVLDSKEGSAIKQAVSLDDDSTLSFDWKFLTNDGDRNPASELPPLPGAPSFPDVPSDRAIVTIYDGTDTVIETFAQSEGDFPGPLTPGEFAKKSQGTLSKDLAAGNYTVGIAVYDLDGTDKTSALLIDNVAVEKLSVKTPEPVNILGIIAVAGIGYFTKRRRDN